jgi:hypothetical protein
MALITRKNQPFTTITKNNAIQGDNIVFVKGGSTIIDDTWVQLNDLKIDLKNLITTFISKQARRIFNAKNGILYVVITIDKNSTIEVIPSISLNQTALGNVKVFASLENRLPLMLVKLTQDGSNDLSSFLTITPDDIEVYQGYGNLTLSGPQGKTGPVGDTGAPGLLGDTGIMGLVGLEGVTGPQGLTGPFGPIGDTGSKGLDGILSPRFIQVSSIDPIANFIGSPVSGASPLEVHFTNLSLGQWTSLLWDLGDGNTSTDENPTHIYTVSGIYSVTLYLYGIANDSENVRYNYITVS